MKNVWFVQTHDRSIPFTPMSLARREGVLSRIAESVFISRKPDERRRRRGHRAVCGLVRDRVSRRFSRAISLIVSGIAVSNAAAGGIPVGIAVARQRLQHQETSTSMRNVSLSHHTSHHATSYHHFQPDGLGESPAPSGFAKLSFRTRGRERLRSKYPPVRNVK